MRKSIEVDLTLIAQYDSLITDLELTIVREAKRHDADAFHRLRSVPGIGKVLALTILYEIHDIRASIGSRNLPRTRGSSKCQKQSGGKTLGTSGAKMGNVHLKWAFSEAAVLFLRHTKDGKQDAGGDREEARQREGALDPGPQDRAGGVLHAVARDGVFAREIPRGVAGRARASQTSNSSHGTELAQIAPHACADQAPRATDHEPQVRQRARLTGRPRSPRDAHAFSAALPLPRAWR